MNQSRFRMALRTVFGAWLLMLAGCGGSDEQEQLELARSSVQTGLDAWKRGDEADALRAANPAMEFFDDDWLQGIKLLDFKIVRTFIDTDALPRCATELTVQRPDGTSTSTKVVYQVVKKPHVVVARDPFN